MKTLDEIIAALKAANDSLMALLDLAAPTEEQVAEAKSLASTVEDLKRQKSEAEARIEQKQAAIELQKQLDADARKSAQRINDLPNATTTSQTAQVTSGARSKSKHFKNNQEAVLSTHFIRAAMGNEQSLTWMNDNAKQYTEAWGNGIRIKASNQTESNDFQGGVLVPVEFEQAVINLREQFGVFRKYADVRPMTKATRKVAKSENHSNVFAIGEGSTFTQTDMSWREINLVAKKFGAYLKYSAELNDDAMVNIADEIAKDLAVSFEQMLDKCAFIGDGSDTYSGIIGLTQYPIWLVGQNGGTWTTDSNKAYSGATYTASAAAWSSLVAGDIDGLRYKTRAYPGFKGVYFCNQNFYGQVIERLKTAVGGTTMTEVTNGTAQNWKGIPVVFVDSMPSTSGASAEVDTIPLIYGDLSMGAILGDRQGIAIDTQSTYTDWYSDMVGVKAKARWDIKVTDMGNYNTTAASRTGGAVAALAIKHS